ncbi:MAG: hypothetical protein ABII90_05535 [Bacteroidota bacterium]
MNAEKQTNRKNNIAVILGILLALSVIGNIFLMNKKSEIKTEMKYITKEMKPVIETTVMLEKELQATVTELEKYKGISARLDSVVDEANTKIKAQEAKITKLGQEAKSSKELTAQLQVEIDNLLKLKIEYLEKIDDLLMKNEKLKSQNLGLNKTIGGLQSEIRTLKGKIALGENLLADNMAIKPIKKNLVGNFTRTAMAKKTKKIEVCFDVLENKLAKKGKQTVYIKIITPEGVTILDKAAGSDKIERPESITDNLYTTYVNIVYANVKQNVCIEWIASQNYKAGTYFVELYTKQNKMGVASFALR